MIPQQAPRLRVIGLQLHRALQGINCFVAVTRSGERQGVLEMGGNPCRLLDDQRDDEIQRRSRITGQPARSCQHQTGRMVFGGGFENLQGLFGSEVRIDTQQFSGVCQRDAERAGWFSCGAHG